MPLAILTLLAVGALFLYGKRSLDSARIEALTASEFPETLEPLPDLDARAFFWEQHARCFDEHYRRTWGWGRLNREAYALCIEQGYVSRLSRIAVLEDPVWSPHMDPAWGRLDFTVRVREGRLPQRPILRNSTDCHTGGRSFGEGPTNIDLYDELEPGVYRTDTLAFLRDQSCDFTINLYYDRWPLAEPLTVQTPLPDAELMAAKEENERLKREASERSARCIAEVRAKLTRPAAFSPAISPAVTELGSPDVRKRQEAVRTLERMSSEARGAFVPLVETLSDTNINTKESIIRALAAIDPEGREVMPILRCLLQEPAPTVRLDAGAALAKLGDPSGAHAVARDLESPEESTRLLAVDRLRGAHGAPAIPALVNRLKVDPSPRVRMACLDVLPWTDPDSEVVVQAIQNAHDDPDPDVRARAEVAIVDLQRARLRH